MRRRTAADGRKSCRGRNAFVGAVERDCRWRDACHSVREPGDLDLRVAADHLLGVTGRCRSIIVRLHRNLKAADGIDLQLL